MKKQSETQIKIVEFIKTHPSASPQAIIDGTGLPNITAYSMLKSLMTGKAIEMKVVDGKKTYTLTDESVQVRPVVETLNTNHVDKKKDTKKFQKTSKRDTSKFKFNGSISGKSEIVRLIVHQYVKDHPSTTYAKLKTIFPDELFKTYGVFQAKSAAVKVSKERPRFFLNDDHLIRLKDKSIIAITNQVSAGSAWDSFLTHARKLGYVVRVV